MPVVETAFDPAEQIMLAKREDLKRSVSIAETRHSAMVITALALPDEPMVMPRTALMSPAEYGPAAGGHAQRPSESGQTRRIKRSASVTRQQPVGSVAARLGSL